MVLLVILSLSAFCLIDIKGALTPAGGGLALNNYDDGDGYQEFIFLDENIINADGYLVEWRYYLRKAEGNACDTYAAVWRHDMDYFYYKITQAKLTYNRLVQGVQVQRVYPLVKLRYNDVISVFVDQKDGCSGSLIAISSQSGQYARILSNRLYSPVSDWADVAMAESAVRAVAIQAYVEEYVVLKSPPSASHTISLKAGQIMLSWEAYHSNDSEFLLVGYRIICFVHTLSIACCNETVPANITEIVINNLDQKTPLRADVQVIRTFNGQDVTDGFSQSSSQFCPEREALSSESVTISSIDTGKHANLSVSVAIEVLDDCVAEWSVVFRGPTNSTTATLSKNINTLWTLAESSFEYNLSIIFRLVDGHKAVVFQSLYRTKQAPPAPTNITVHHIGSSSVYLNWTQPRYMEDNITSYEVLCSVANKTNVNTTRIESNTTGVRIDDLVRDVCYDCLVKALLPEGGSGFSGHIVFCLIEQLIDNRTSTSSINDTDPTVYLPISTRGTVEKDLMFYASTPTTSSVKAEGESHKTSAIAAGVTVPLIFVLGAGLLSLFIWRQRCFQGAARKKGDEDNEMYLKKHDVLTLHQSDCS